jgi:hypothetical protein
MLKNKINPTLNLSLNKIISPQNLNVIYLKAPSNARFSGTNVLECNIFPV